MSDNAGDIIDVNIHLSRWPFRRVAFDDTPGLVKKLRSVGVKQAWACSYDAILHRDIGAVNQSIAEDCDANGDGVLVPIGAINLALPDWEEDLRRCRDVYKMPGVRLYPNYHGYKLDDPAFAKFLSLASDSGLLVQIAISMEDERNQHTVFHVPPVDHAPLPALLAKFPKAKVMLLNALHGPRSALLTSLLKIENVSFDIATLENVGGVGIVLEQIAAERLLYGSHAPFFYPESASLKMKESPLGDDVRAKILSGNASRILNRNPS